MLLKTTLLFSVLLFFINGAFAQTDMNPTTVVIVRHAEKDKIPKDDPALTNLGIVRASHLATMLNDAGVQAIYTSQYQRSKQTAAPLARNLSIQPKVLNAENSQEFVKSIQAENKGQIVLVVGHTDTVPEIIQMLGGPQIEVIDETEYDNFFILTIPETGKATLLKLKYN